MQLHLIGNKNKNTKKSLHYWSINLYLSARHKGKKTLVGQIVIDCPLLLFIFLDVYVTAISFFISFSPIRPLFFHYFLSEADPFFPPFPFFFSSIHFNSSPSTSETQAAKIWETKEDPSPEMCFHTQGKFELQNNHSKPNHLFFFIKYRCVSKMCHTSVIPQHNHSNSLPAWLPQCTVRVSLVTLHKGTVWYNSQNVKQVNYNITAPFTEEKAVLILTKDRELVERISLLSYCIYGVLYSASLPCITNVVQFTTSFKTDIYRAGCD